MDGLQALHYFSVEREDEREDELKFLTNECKMSFSLIDSTKLCFI